MRACEESRGTARQAQLREAGEAGGTLRDHLGHRRDGVLREADVLSRHGSRDGGDVAKGVRGGSGAAVVEFEARGGPHVQPEFEPGNFAREIPAAAVKVPVESGEPRTRVVPLLLREVQRGHRWELEGLSNGHVDPRKCREELLRS